MENEAVRELVSESGISYRKIAKRMNISNVWLCRMMSRPLSLGNRLRILDALADIQKESSQ